MRVARSLMRPEGQKRSAIDAAANERRMGGGWEAVARRQEDAGSSTDGKGEPAETEEEAEAAAAARAARAAKVAATKAAAAVAAAAVVAEAAAEGLTLEPGNSASGYKGVNFRKVDPNPYP